MSGGALLPVVEALPALEAALRATRRAVLVAPPGSGKTTVVGPWLMDSGLVGGGEVVMLQPRRVAARSVARFIAAERGEGVGQTVGYQVRFEREVSEKTRLRVVTEGILTRRLQADPALDGVAAVILDEFHERSIHADLALALLREVQEALRPDLLLVVMSATLEAGPVARFLGDCPVVRAEGRTFPVETLWAEEGIGPQASADEVARSVAAGVGQVRRWLAEHHEVKGRDILAFLPGVAAIEATRTRLGGPLAAEGWDVVALHGKLPAGEQDAVLRGGRRPRVVLATNIAETSLTLPHVGAVVDAGLAKLMRFDVGVGAERLELQRVSRASADQRRGRAGRVGPGVALRLWTRLEDERLRAFDPPEIGRVELGRTLLELYNWGVNPFKFDWFEKPPDSLMWTAREGLCALGALEGARGGGERGPHTSGDAQDASALGAGRVTALGRRLVALPTELRVAAFLEAAERMAPDAVDEAVRWAAVLEEGAGAGALEALWGRTLGARGRVERALAGALGRGERVEGGRRAALSGMAVAEGRQEALTLALLAGFRDRLAVRIDGEHAGGHAGGRARYAMAGGREAMLVGAEAGEAPDAVIALQLDGGRRGEGSVSRIHLWHAVRREVLEAHPERVRGEEVAWDAAARRVVASRVTRLFEVVLDRRPVPNADRERAGRLLAEMAQAAPEEALGALGADDEGMLARVVTWARLGGSVGLDASWPRDRAGWVQAVIPLMAEGLASFEDLRRKPTLSVREAVAVLLGWELRARLDALLPESVVVPSGSRIRLAYQYEGSPILAVKIQELFGLSETPRFANGAITALLHLLSPAGRPLQVTRDLASFWTNTWPAVRAEMRTRYPKHHWPEDPSQALPSARTTARRVRDSGEA